MLLFLDTEFGDLEAPEPKLLSIALVPEDGRNPFYAEVSFGDGWNFWDCSYFVQETVLPLMKGGDCLLSRDDLRERLLAWFATMPRYVQVACDSEIDFRLLKGALGDEWPGNLNQRYFDLRPLVDTTVFDKAAFAYYTPTRRAHHALNDAEANRIGWLAWMDAKKGGR